MSTRSNIGIINANGTVAAIYCHNGGYPSGVGQTLLDNYNTEDKVRELLRLGDISSLGNIVGEKHDFDWMSEYTADRYDEMQQDARYVMCNAYGRDRAETGTKAGKYTSVKDACSSMDNDYTYLFIVAENRWTFRKYTGPFQPLTVEACED